MNLEIFHSLEELYERLLPALRCKKREMMRAKYGEVTEQELWNYMYQKIWKYKHDLTLSEMVDDILNTDSYELCVGLRNEAKYGTDYSE